MPSQAELEYFRRGADAMRSRIAAWLMAKGRMDLAPLVLVLDLPRYQEPETMVLRDTKED